MFGTVLTVAVTLMHVYVFWRAGTVPYLINSFSRKYIYGTGLLLWTVFYTSRKFRHGDGIFSEALELYGMNWMAVLFITSVTLLIVDIVTVFGLLFRKQARVLRGIALASGALLSLFALFQGMRPPVVRNHDVYLPGLPPELNGTVAVALSDLHLGSHIGGQWLRGRVGQVLAERPDVVFLLGDVFDGHGLSVDEILPEMQRLTAPLGVWAVNGNHDRYGRRNAGEFIFDSAGIRVLHDSNTEVAPGLIVAGVDNLSGRGRSGRGREAVLKSLGDRPEGAAVFLSHFPLYADAAAEAGAGLMLSGHTHGGQIWPFEYLVEREYPLLAGRYVVNGMTVIVSRGAGTWGPRMRLWQPGEILRLTLYAE